VIARLKKFNAIGGGAVDESVLLPDSPTPKTGQRKFEGFGPANAFEWIGEDGCHHVKNSDCYLAVRLDPVL